MQMHRLGRTFTISIWHCAIAQLTLKVPITTTADDSFDFFFFLLFTVNESWQMIQMKCQDLFSLEKK